MNRICLLFLFGLLFITGCEQASSSSNTTEITISAASSLMDSLVQVKDEFKKEYPHIKVTYNFGGSGTLRRQIEQGAPIDLFFSASKKDYELLRDSHLIKHGAALLQNRLVMITTKKENTNSFAELLQSDKKIAIGSPEAVPAGTYAQQALQEMGVWEELYDRFVFTKDVLQVLTLVEKGAVEAGMVYLSDVHETKKMEIIKEISSSRHLPIEYYVATIKSETEESDKLKQAKEAFYQYVLQDSSMQIFQNNGFIINNKEELVSH